MEWTHTIKSRNEIQAGIVEVVVEHNNGTDTTQKTYQVSSKEELVKKVNRYVFDEERKAKLSTELNVDDPVEKEVKDPTQEELDQKNWFDSYMDLRAAKALEALGVDVINAGQMSALQNKVKNGFKREYAALINS